MTTIKFEFTVPIKIWAIPPCCTEPILIGCILDLKSPNPVLLLDHPFGINGILKIIEMIDEIKSNAEHIDQDWIFKGESEDASKKDTG